MQPDPERSLKKSCSRGQRPQTGATVHLSARQRPEASSQDNAGAASGQVCDCP
ncbi:hypothetical protein LDENG_00031570 [Lucifuga dentata]|nr:hypothetical protein LDENG_00031570 [Lucifuga dentata]